MARLVCGAYCSSTNRPLSWLHFTRDRKDMPSRLVPSASSDITKARTSRTVMPLTSTRLSMTGAALVTPFAVCALAV